MVLAVQLSVLSASTGASVSIFISQGVSVCQYYVLLHQIRLLHVTLHLC